MFKFFKNLPSKISLEIISYLTINEQIILGKVNRFFNALTKDRSLKLTKLIEAAPKHSIGDICVIISRKKAKDIVYEPYRLFVTRNGLEIPRTGMSMSFKSYDKFKKILREDSPFIIRRFKAMRGVTMEIIVKILEKEFDKIKTENRSNLPSLMLFSARKIINNAINDDRLTEECKNFLSKYKSDGLHERFYGMGNDDYLCTTTQNNHAKFRAKSTRTSSRSLGEKYSEMSFLK